MFEWMKRLVTAEDSNMTDARVNTQVSFSRLDRKQWLAIIHVHEEAVMTICHSNQTDDEICSSLEKLLRSTPHIAETVNLCGTDGLNLLLHAIKSNLPLTCSYLVRQGADLNAPWCNRPLHMAARLGRSNLVTMLLDFGSDPETATNLCFQDSNFGTKPLYNPETMSWTRECISPNKHQDFPLYFAILSDDSDCIRVLLDRNCTATMGNIPPLHIACREGKYNAARYLISRDSKVVTEADTAGYVAIQYAVKWGQEFLQLLVQSGSSVMALTKRRETLLHLLFQDTQTLTGLAECVKYLLYCGLNMNINVVDDMGNSALMVLLNNIPLLLKNHSDQGSPAEEPQYIEFINSARLLLQARCNPNICNLVGDRALHILLSGNLPLIVKHQLLHLLLSHKANPNFCNAAGQRPIWILCKVGFNAIFNQSWQALYEGRITSTDLLVECIQLLTQYTGAQKEISIAGQPESLYKQLFTHILTIRRSESVSDDPNVWQLVSKHYMGCIIHICQALLEAGYLPSDWGGRPGPLVVGSLSGNHASDLAYLYYCLITQSQAISFRVTRDLLTLMLRHGADPNVGGLANPLSLVPQNARPLSAPVYPLMHLLHMCWEAQGPSEQSEFGGLVSYKDHEILELVNLFFEVTSSPIASACIRNFVNVDIPHLQHLPDGSINSKRRQFLEHLRAMLSTPKSLHCLAATVIYLHLERKAVKFSQLPLPTAVKEKLSRLQFS